VFGADDLGAWLVGLLADAGSKKLTALVLGSEQERALRQAGAAAVQDTVLELRPAGGTRAEELAMVIGQVFTEPAPKALMAGCATMLEGLRAGIAGQLDPLDNPRLTGTEQSSAELLGVSAAVLAERLTTHLVREIMLRGSGGSPLTPLAAQLSHDATYLQGKRTEKQGERIENLLRQLAREVIEAVTRLNTIPTTAPAGDYTPTPNKIKNDPRRPTGANCPLAGHPPPCPSGRTLSPPLLCASCPPSCARPRTSWPPTRPLGRQVTIRTEVPGRPG